MCARIRGMRLAAIAMLLLCAIAMPARAATITVINTNDSSPGSLRQALTIANDGDTIAFTVTGTITLTSGGLLIAKNLTISGLGSDQLSIDGNQALVFGVFPGKTATIAGLTVTKGELGIWNEGATLTVSNCAVSSNSYGGLYNHEGASSVSNCVVSGNSYGLYNHHGALRVSNCVISGNSSYGGLGNNGVVPPNDHTMGIVPLTITDSIISDNLGPGVSNISATVTIVNSTITGNSAGQDWGDGGGISSDGAKVPGSVTVTNSTIGGNSAFYDGGGIYSGFST
jgi:hypothetical protein